MRFHYFPSDGDYTWSDYLAWEREAMEAQEATAKDFEPEEIEMQYSYADKPRIVAKSIISNQYGQLETTDKLGIRRHRFFSTRKQAADFLRKLRSWRRRPHVNK